MNPFRAPKTEPEEPDSSVLAVYEQRVNKFAFGGLGIIGGAFFLATAMKAPNDDAVVGYVTGGAGLLVGAGMLWSARRRGLVAAIGQSELTLVGLRDRVVVRRDGIRSVAWVDRYNEGPGTMILELTESEWMAVGDSSTWDRRIPVQAKVEWSVADDTTPPRIEFRKALDDWIALNEGST